MSARFMSKVNSIDAKFDMLIAAATPAQTSSTLARPRQHQAPGADVRLPPLCALPQQSDRDGYVERMLQEVQYKAKGV